MTQPLKTALILGSAITLAGVLSYLATISHGYVSTALPAFLAVAATMMGSLPPLLFGRLLANGAGSQLAVVAWRLAVMLPALAIAPRLPGDERNCYLISLLACYFVALPLESWLLIRDVRRKQESQP